VDGVGRCDFVRRDLFGCNVSGSSFHLGRMMLYELWCWVRLPFLLAVEWFSGPDIEA
jgi:hypothetical protein